MSDEETKVEEVVAAPAEAVAVEVKPLELRSGMTVKVHEKIEDVTPKGEKRTRIQIFEGIILGIRGSGISRTMTVRKVSDGIGVEKIYPMSSPVVSKIELVKTAHVRRAKLNFLTDRKYRFARKLKEVWVKTDAKKKKK
ncbi:MAG: 50S ribosomal protein L19 [Candidatus Uhrbacteria bacterium]